MKRQVPSSKFQVPNSKPSAWILELGAWSLELGLAAVAILISVATAGGQIRVDNRGGARADLLLLLSRHAPSEGHPQPRGVELGAARRTGRHRPTGCGRAEGRSDFRQVPGGDRRRRSARHAY